MKNFLNRKNSVALFIILSLLAHLVAMYVLMLSGPLKFNTPVQPLSAIFVTIKNADAPPSIKTGTTSPVSTTRSQQPVPRPGKSGVKAGNPDQEVISAKNFSQPRQHALEDGPARVFPLPHVKQATSSSSGENQEATGSEDGSDKNYSSSHIHLAVDYDRYKGPVRDTEEFLVTKKEKLTYRISLLKIPVGTAVMEATNSNDEFRVSITISSNAVFSAVYPVNDLVETRMIKGNYLLTRVRQSEGNYRGDFGFTLMLREHKAFWVDRLANSYNYVPLPVDDVMDAVSGFYFLRNRILEVGNSVELHLFDSNEYSPTTVEVLRKERISLPGGDEVDALVLHPLFKTAGFFRRTGDILIWLTDDQFRMPVRLETFISLGKVTAELIAAESEPEEKVKE